MSYQPDLIYLQCALACAGVAVLTDLRSRRIPNWLTGPAFISGLCLHLALGGWRQMGAALLAAVIAGGLFLLLFLAGGMGAGDVKLMAATASLAGLQSIREMLLATVLLGALFAIVAALASGRLRQTLTNSWALLVHHQSRGLVTHPELNVRNQSMLRMPYALPIAGGCLGALLLMMHGGVSL